MAEKPDPGSAPSNLAGIARYLLTPAIFDCIDAAPLDRKGELNITEPIVRLMQKEPVTALEVDDTRLDIGNPTDYAAATLFFARNRLGLRI
jgi:UTP--glucose-1-phosphate uridylyltransferase